MAGAGQARDDGHRLIPHVRHEEGGVGGFVRERERRPPVGCEDRLLDEARAVAGGQVLVPEHHERHRRVERLRGVRAVFDLIIIRSVERSIVCGRRATGSEAQAGGGWAGQGMGEVYRGWDKGGLG